jgi:membrane associated rhomboid family serine protease
MHGGFTHILFNMYALWAFGSPLELIWGKNKFLLFYFLCGLGAGIVYTLVNYFQFNNLYNELIGLGISPEELQTILETGQLQCTQAFGLFRRKSLRASSSLFTIPVVGASGAIYGVLVAFGILFPNSKLMLLFFPFPIAAKYFIPALACAGSVLRCNRCFDFWRRHRSLRAYRRSDHRVFTHVVLER